MIAMKYAIYTDGGCSGNPGPGGWAYVLVEGTGQLTASGFEAETTNNRMELTAVLKALEYAAGRQESKGREITVYTDSQYVKRGITEWIHTWEKNGWKTSNKKPVKNQDLWKSLKSIADTVPVSWEWLKGHAGDPLNELCDALVQKAIADGGVS
jgi:ribonuclease HI